MLAKTYSSAIMGIDACLIEVEVDIIQGLPYFSTVGLPDGAVKLRVYVPEAALSSVSVGTTLSVNCDGCGDGMTATISYVASDPEFTPPVIYSLQNRQKLVYLVEAIPGAQATALQPGQIVDVRLGGNDDERH